MKNKIFILLAISAIVTLSFTFASTKKSVAKEKPTSSVDSPSGGFYSEGKF